jgi:hypothetical protein
MQVRGSVSWQFSASEGNQLLHAALFIRDALALPMSGAPDVPPALLGAVVDRRDQLADADGDALSRQWIAWWRRIVAKESGTDAADPPTDAGIPPLLRAHFADALSWRTGDLPRPARRGRFDAEMLGEVVHEISTAHDVPVGRLSGRVLLLAVRGQWWCPVRPGAALCSVAAAADPHLARTVAANVLASSRA